MSTLDPSASSAIELLDLGTFSLSIDAERNRLKEIVRGKIRDDLKKFMSSDELIAQSGNDKIKVPLPKIDLPHFRHNSDKEQEGGMGQGDAQPGEATGEEEGEGQEASTGAAEHATEEISLDELASMMAETLQLPRIEPKGKKMINGDSGKYNSIARVGPESLRHPKRTLRETLLRQIAANEYDPDDPILTPIRQDFRYRALTPDPKPQANALIIFLRDYSGSMGEEETAMTRIASFWINLWLRANYESIESRFILHDEQARIVEEHDFFHSQSGGGTIISSAYNQIERLFTDYPPDEWNIYVFQFSDGDNYSSDNDVCVRLLKEKILPHVNLFAYGQVAHSGWNSMSGGFKRVIDNAVGSDERVVASAIDSRGDIPRVLKEFFSPGR